MLKTPGVELCQNACEYRFLNIGSACANCYIACIMSSLSYFFKGIFLR